MTQAPPALVKLTVAYHARTDRPASYVLAGIVGDAAHMSPPEGYHVSARDEHFNWGGYSLDTARDRAGGKKYPDYASAWDLHFGPADMALITGRLITAAKAKDPRLNAVAEIAGTTNDHTVHAYYVNTGTDDPTDSGGWDSGHLTHVHLSISRDDCDNYPALLPILDVLCGVPLHPPEPPTRNVKERDMGIYQVAADTLPKGTPSPGVFTFDGSSVRHVEAKVGTVSNVAAILAATGQAKVEDVTYAQYETWLGK